LIVSAAAVRILHNWLLHGYLQSLRLCCHQFAELGGMQKHLVSEKKMQRRDLLKKVF
jgi:hypothetical protein